MKSNSIDGKVTFYYFLTEGEKNGDYFGLHWDLKQLKGICHWALWISREKTHYEL